MIQDLYRALKQLESELYLHLDADRRRSIRRLCGDIFASAENLLQESELSAAQKKMLEGIAKAANTIDDTITGDFDRIKANEGLVKPYVLELEERAAELGIVVKMKTGKAYAFLNYEGRWTELVGDLGVSRDMANFPDTFRLIVLDDKISTMDMDGRVRAMYDCERERLPAKIAQLAETTEVHGSVASDCSPDTFRKLPNKPVKAASLRYLVMAEAPEVSDSESAGPLGQDRANQVTAGMLKEVLGIVADRERERRASDVSREAIFYQDSRGRAQRYV